MSLAAAETSDPGGLLSSTWAQGGAVLVLVGALLWLAWTGIQRERQRADAQDTWIRTEAFPALVKSTEALTRVSDILGSNGAGRP